GLLHGQCGIEAQPAEADAVAGLDLTDLPQFGADYGDRTDEAAQAGPVLGQDDRHVAGEVDRADGVFGVMDIGWMQAGFAAVRSEEHTSELQSRENLVCRLL